MTLGQQLRNGMSLQGKIQAQKLPPLGSSVFGFFFRVPADGTCLKLLNFEFEIHHGPEPLADRLEASQRESSIQEACDSFSVDRKLPLRRPGQELYFKVIGCGWCFMVAN